jgi:hypothetical protein
LKTHIYLEEKKGGLWHTICGRRDVEKRIGDEVTCTRCQRSLLSRRLPDAAEIERVGDIVQIKPDNPEEGLLLVVSEVRPWGVVGYIPGRVESGPIHLRRGEYEGTGGRSAWVVGQSSPSS